MMDAVQLPILLKAIDFIFEEGRKILEERRERRKSSNPGASGDEPPTPAPTTTAPEDEPKGDTKQDLLNTKIDEILWQNHEADVRHLVKLLETYSNNYQLAQQQYAQWGSALVPPIIVHNLTESENAMLETLKRLEAVLSKVYKKDIKAVE